MPDIYRIIKQSFYGIAVLLLVTDITSCRQPVIKNKKAKSQNWKVPIRMEEVVGKDINADTLLKICKEGRVPAWSVYQWQDHYVIYQNFPVGPGSLLQQIKAKYPTCTIKKYPDPFYDFERKYCADTTIAGEWQSIILTANLVDDPKKQQEYLDYHKTQFQKWPEVSKGFCNASFQELQVFKQGRQLMLVISIPKGASLDKLNPKTTENNPKVDEWNKIMSKYQEGIPGTKPGEVWVFFKPLGKKP